MPSGAAFMVTAFMATANHSFGVVLPFFVRQGTSIPRLECFISSGKQRRLLSDEV